MDKLPQTFIDLLHTSSTDALNVMLKSLQSELTKRAADPVNLTEYVPDFCTDEVLLSAIHTECEDLNLASGRKVSTQFLSTSGDPYIYPDTDPVHKAIDISKFPNICALMELINSSDHIDGPLNSCLVMKYPGPQASLSLHSDNEPTIDQQKSICSFTIGSSRTIEFYKKSAKNPKPKCSQYRLSEGGLLIMKPGCQSHLEHFVRQETSPFLSSQSSQSGNTQVRFSLSFRAHSKDNVMFKSPTSPTHTSNSSNPSDSPSSSNNEQYPLQRITVIAGDSFAARLNADRLSKGKRKIINIAKGGQKISDVAISLAAFISNNPNVYIEKLIVSVGTNDIRHCRLGVGHLKGPLKQLATKIRELTPNTKVFFQSLLPLPLMRNADAKRVINNVITFNRILMNFCIYEKMYFINVFPQFLDHKGQFRDSYLFKSAGDIHPNNRGMGVLAKWYIFTIHNNRFNPFVFQ